MRKHEIDWIRNICILLLFVFHTVSIFTYYEPWYILSESKSWIATLIYILCIPWHMPILFFLAGASTRFSLEHRGGKKYMKERINRLLIPFIFGILVLVPPQGYLGILQRGKYVESYFEQWKFFWSNVTNVPYDGSWGPAHLWFILYLFIISLIGLLIVKSFEKNFMKKFLEVLKHKLLGKYSLIIIVLTLSIADFTKLAIAEKNILVFLIVFLMGYIVYSDEEYLIHIDKNKKISFIISFTLSIIYTLIILYYYKANVTDGFRLEIILSLIRNALMVTIIISIIGYGRKYLSKSGQVLKYLNNACFPVYILHQTIIVLIGYFVLKINLPVYSLGLIIMMSSIFITFIIYEILRRIKVIRYLIGIKA